MTAYWQTAKFAELRRITGSGRLAGTIIREGCSTLQEFCAKYTLTEMLRCPGFGPGSASLMKQLAEQHGLELRGTLVLGRNATDKPYHLTAYGGGGLLSDRWCTHWGQLGGIIGNLADDADRITVYNRAGEILLHYDKHGVFLR